MALDALGLAMLELCNQCGSPQCYRIARDQDTWAAELTSPEGHLLARSYPQLSPSDAQALISLAIDQGPRASVGWSMAEDSSR